MLLYTTGCRTPSARYGRGLREQYTHAVQVDVVCKLDGVWRGGRGSGVIVSHNLVLTAEHVVECPGDRVVTVAARGGNPRFVTVDRVWAGRDIARLRLREGTFGFMRPLHVRGVTASLMATAVTWPFAGLYYGRVLNTHATVCKPDKPFCHNFEFSARTVPGNSGGAIYDAEGFLIGIVTGGFFDKLPPSGLGSELAPIAGEVLQ